MNIIVSKYGGSSIVTESDIEHIKKITEDDPQRRVIVVSAPGKRYKEDTKVTDLLIDLAESKDKKLISTIMDRYKMLASEQEMSDLENILINRFEQCLPAEIYADALKAFGEEACAKIVAKQLNARYLDPRELFLVTADFSHAKILSYSGQMIQKTISGKDVYVVPGFYGYTNNGQIATFSRGGSDLTGAYLAAALNAIVYENFTDRDGILAADPALVDNPHKIKEMTFNEIRDLAYSGFTIFHQDAMEPLEGKNIPVHVRKTAIYPHKGTYLVCDRISDPEKPIVGVAYQNGFCSFNVDKFGLNEDGSVFEKIVEVFKHEKVPIRFLSNSIDDLTVIVKESTLGGINKVGTLKATLAAVTRARVVFEQERSCLVVAGKGLRGRRGIAADIQTTLAQAGVNLFFISQGSQERSIIYGIHSTDGKKAVNAIYDGYFR